jgi:hypothetical protein
MYLPDLSPYNPASKEFEILSTLAVGWLDQKHLFPTVDPTEDFLCNLLGFCKVRIRQTRGFHQCEFCDQFSNTHPFVQENDETIWLGSAELRVIGKEKVYASPNLIYHYVSDHRYSPPEEFTQSVLHGPQPNDEVYQSLVVRYKKREFTKLF